MSTPRVSVVAPIFNESAILLELASRCVVAARRVDGEAEVLLIDDGSTDRTRQIAAEVDPGATVVHLPQNVGQLRATQAGLGMARGDVVVVLDGDLQDPPEILPELVRKLDSSPGVDVVFAVKVSRDDPAWFRAGRLVYGLLTRLPGTRIVPAGAGAYCAMRRPWAGRIARLQLPDANLAAVLVALGARIETVPYAKAARYDGASRVGAWGLAREAVGSLILTGAAARLCAATALIAALVALSTPAAVRVVAMVLAVVGALLTLATTRLARQRLGAALASPAKES
jgi:glycosyltransferase involved in cell wall biosynthesis